MSILLLWFYYRVMIPLFAGAFIAYFVSPWDDALQRRRVNRGIATALIMIFWLGLLGLVKFRLGPLFYEQLRDLIYRFPTLIDSHLNRAIGKLRDLITDSGLRETADSFLSDSDIGELFVNANVNQPKIRKINLDLPEWLLDHLDLEASRVDVSRQPLIKLWLIQKLEAERKKRYA
ncbi:MAG: AI-2E family transporter [Proteobacteria bacterium]|nr:AI-2E family transporter [Pseudomonadota bacterium]